MGGECIITSFHLIPTANCLLKRGSKRHSLSNVICLLLNLVASDKNTIQFRVHSFAGLIYLTLVCNIFYVHI